MFHPEIRKRFRILTYGYPVLLFVLSLIYAALISPMFVKVCSDVSFAAAWFYVFDILAQIWNTVTFFVMLSVLLYLMRKHRGKELKRAVFATYSMILLKYVLCLTFSYLYFGSPSEMSVFTNDILNLGLNIGVEWVELSILLGIAYSVAIQFERKMHLESAAFLKLPPEARKSNYTEFPYGTVPHTQNAILAMMFWSTLAHWLIRIILGIVDSVNFIIAQGSGNVFSADFGLTCLYETLLGIAGFLFSSWLISELHTALSKSGA